jgi:hypothetical protein
VLIGVISDNHGLIDPELLAVLAGVEEIWHAGDFVTPDILPVLKQIAPVFAVRGNNDHAAALHDLPEELLLERQGHRVLLRHIVGRPPKIEPAARKAVQRERATIVVMGHSHRPDATFHGGVLYLNPGSCGPRRFSLPRTAARLELGRNAVTFTVVNLDTREAMAHRFTV